MNVLEQMKHLLSYPYIAEKYKIKKLEILGWYYIIETGEVFNYNRDSSRFEIIS